MAFTRPDIETIKTGIEKGIEARLFGGTALLRNSILRILSRVFAGAIHGNYGYIEWLTKQLFITTAEEDYLLQHATMWNVKRKAGSYATGTVIFTGTDSTVIPVNTLLQYDDGTEYATLTEVTISGGTGTTTIQSVEAADSSNKTRPTPPDPIYLQMVSPITGIENIVQIDGDITGGEDIEEVEAWRTRILQRIQYTPLGGSEADYVRWALEFTGVSRAWCYPIYDGPGTVVTVITATGSDPVPSAQLVSDVNAYINDRKPVTAGHRTASIQAYNYTDGKTVVAMSIRITPLSSDITALIESNLQALYLPHKPGTRIPISQIRAAISNSGVTDYIIDTITLDGNIISVGDILLDGFQYPWCGTLSISELT